MRAFGLTPDWRVDGFPERYTGKVLFLASPNSPLGFAFGIEYAEELARRCDGVVVVVEAYADFARLSALDLVRRLENVVVTRTFSKSYSLAGMRGSASPLPGRR